MSPAYLRVDADELGLDRWGERVGVGRVVIHVPTENLGERNTEPRVKNRRMAGIY